MLISGLAPGILSLAGTRTGELALTQTPDTTGIYKDRSDSLDATVLWAVRTEITFRAARNFALK